MALTRAVFLDKDGTLVENVPFNVDLRRIVLVPGAGPALRRLARAGYRLIAVTNQPGVALGRFPLSALEAVQARLEALLVREGVPLAGFYACPHHPAGHVVPYARPCDCRKPGAGLLARAAREHCIDLAASWLVGDILDDVEAGRRAGCRAVLIDNGNETEWRKGPLRAPHHVARDLGGAAEAILAGAPDAAATLRAARDA